MFFSDTKIFAVFPILKQNSPILPKNCFIKHLALAIRRSRSAMNVGLYVVKPSESEFHKI